MNKIIRRLSYLTTSLALLFYWQASYAEDVLKIFSPKPVVDGTDKSIVLLGQLFGTVDGVLHGYGTQIMGVMFGVFNSAVIGVGGIIIFYTLVVSTLNTAHEGEYLGKKWSSMWIPIRSTMGVALLIPKASGYSMIQIFVMWVVVQGVGAADTLWKTTFDYIKSTGTIMPTKISASDIASIVDSSANILKMQICLQAVNKNYKANKGVDLNLRPKLVFDKSSDVYTVHFPSNEQIVGTGLQSDMCGFITFNKNSDDTVNTALVSAVQQMLLDQEPYAKVLIQQDQLNDTTRAVTNIKNAALDYIGILDPAIHRANSYIDEAYNKMYKGVFSDGWITAGRYYQTLAGLNKDRASIAQNTLTVNFPDSISTYTFGFSRAVWTSGVEDPMKWITKKIIGQAKNELKAGPSTNVSITGKLPRVSGMGDTIDKIINVFTGDLIGMSKAYWEQGFGKKNVDPVVGLVSLGNRLLRMVSNVWLAIAGIIFVATFVTSLLPCTKAFATAINATLLWIIPLMTMLLGLLFTAGAVLAFYVPLIPYIIFLFGAIGWFMGVIESMIAAPLVALGVTHPEGHEAYGRAEPAIMLIVNIFLRPSLMIIGFIVGILLSYVGTKLLNIGFGPAVAEMTNAGGNAWSDGYKALAIILIYTLLVTLILNKAFSLITEVPNKVLRWIGGSEQLGDSSAPLDEIKGGVSGVASKYGSTVSEMSGETAKGAMDAGTSAGQSWWKGKDTSGSGGGLSVTTGDAGSVAALGG